MFPCRPRPCRTALSGWIAVLALAALAIPGAARADSYEPNDTWMEAHEIQSGVQIESWISRPDDIDWFRFTTGEGGYIEVTLTSIPQGQDYDLYLYWRDPQSGQLELIGVSDNPLNWDEEISGDTELFGDFYIRIDGYDGSYDPNNSYYLRAVFPAGQPDVQVSVSPTAATVALGQSQQFTATVTGTTNTGVTWSVVEGASRGTVSASGLYTAPASLPSPATATVRATSVADPTKSASATVTITDPTPPGDNVLSMGTGTAPAAIPLNLANEDVVKALQTDIQFDPAVVSYASGQATGRGSGMSFSASVVGGNRVRVILYYADATTLPAGSGAVANLTFNLIGADGTASDLTPAGTILSDPSGSALAVTEEAGRITIGSPSGPTLRVFALRNPGRTRSLQVFVASDQNLQSLLVTAGGSTVAMTEIDPVHEIHFGTVHVPASSGSIEISATGTNDHGAQADAQTTVAF